MACAITWSLDFPLALAWATNATPPGYAMPLVGLGAFGPTLAAFLLAARWRALPGVFGRWRTNPPWIVLGLLLPLAVQLPATLIEVALGGQPAHAGGHLDNVSRAPETEVRLRVLRFAVLAVVAVFAARALAGRKLGGHPPRRRSAGPVASSGRWLAL